MTDTIEGSVVLITGATGAIARAPLNSRGAMLPLFRPLDVTNDEEVAKAVNVAGAVTLLINNAGTNHDTSFMLAPDIAIACEEIEINYLAPLTVTKPLRQMLIKNKGAVLHPAREESGCVGELVLQADVGEFTLQCAVADTIRRWILPGRKWTHLPFAENRDHRINARGIRYPPTGTAKREWACIEDGPISCSRTSRDECASSN